MASKCAGSGLTLAHLQLAHLRDANGGIHRLLSEEVEGKPSV